MKNKTPEQRSEIVRKGIETKRRNKLALEEREIARQELFSGVAAKREEMAQLERHELISGESFKLTGKHLLTHEDIVSGSIPYAKTCGIYFLIDADRVLYVGQSVDVFSRLAAHFGKKRFGRVAVVECAPDLLDKLESLYIHVLKPEMNGTMSNGQKLAPMSFESLFI